MTTDTKTMTGAEFKTRLGGLGLPPSWFAEKIGVTMRTVVRWFDADEVSEQAASCIEELSDYTLNEMRKMIDKITFDIDVTSGELITLKTYRTDAEVPALHRKMPALWHRALTFRVLDHLRAQGATVRIRYK